MTEKKREAMKNKKLDIDLGLRQKMRSQTEKENIALKGEYLRHKKDVTLPELKFLERE